MYHTNLVGAAICAVLLAQNSDGWQRPREYTTRPASLEPVVRRALFLAKGYLRSSSAPPDTPTPLLVPKPAESGIPSIQEIVRRCLRTRGDAEDCQPLWLQIALSNRVDTNHSMKVLLEGLTILAVRTYDLEEIKRCLNDHICLGPPDSLTFQETLEFILNQQTDVGAFGDESTSEIGLRAQKVRETTRSFAESLFRVLEMFCKK